MGVYDDKPWLALYGDGVPEHIEPEFASGLEMLRATVERAGDPPLIHYFDAEVSATDLDRLSDGLAVGLRDVGVEPGDRVGIYLQNVPQFVVALIAGWKRGAIPVSINPMLKQKELALILNDSGATALVCLEGLYSTVARQVVPDTTVRTVVTTSELSFQEGDPPPLLADVERERHDGTHD